MVIADSVQATYILPVRKATGDEVDELTRYLYQLSRHVEVIVVDGSPLPAFEDHAEAWSSFIQVAPNPKLRTLNGKVWGVLTGVELASHDKLVIADDDVRYDDASLARLLNLLDAADVVRPQNYFEPLPWHARWDTARSLLNRVTGGDWPGTLGVRRAALLEAGGYDGGCLFENLELVRTVKALGGREVVASDLFVRRLPPTTRHFFSQRLRQAYDELARPGRLAVELALLPASLLLLKKKPRLLTLTGAGTVLLAEAGRRWHGGTAVFPATSALWAPLWLGERALCVWLAVLARLVLGGVPYHGRVISRAATPPAELAARVEHSRRRLAESKP